MAPTHASKTTGARAQIPRSEWPGRPV